MKICRFATASAAPPRVGIVREDRILDLTAAGVTSLESILDAVDPPARAAAAAAAAPELPLAAVHLLAPIERQEVWAAGVTYLRSKAARMEESDFSATAYDRVYDADRPEIFFKALPEKVVGPGEAVGIRADATWSVPEPELVLVLSSAGRIVGCTIGNDMSSRDIEGANLLYLPQAKTYDRSCAVGPWIELGLTEEAARRRTISIAIRRGGGTVFSGSTSIDTMKRSFSELASWLCRSQRFPHGAALLTGTGIVPDESFTLAAGDEVEIGISDLGALVNPVVVV